MDIQQVIKQTKPFESIYQKVVVNLLYSSSWLNQQQKVFFQQYGLTSKQYNILRILRGAGKPISTAEIRTRMLDNMSDASRIVDRLHKKGLVHKAACDVDNRKVDISLTGPATQLLTRVDSLINDWMADFSNLTAEEAEQLSALLDKMRK